MNKYNKDFSDIFRNSTVNRVLAEKYVESVMGKIKGRKILDIGCGSGYLSRKLALKGAKVTGIEKSRHQLEIALDMEKKENLGITYKIGEAKNLKELVDGKFHIALMSFFLLEMPKPKDILESLRLANEVLDSEGTLVISDAHPHFINMNIGVMSFFMKNNKNYFDNGALVKAKTQTIKGNEISFLNLHYTLEFLLNSLIKCGFSIECIKEVPYLNNPIGIVITARKVKK